MRAVEEGRYIVSGKKRLRCGYTTGACAAAAAKAAALLLRDGEAPGRVSLRLPGGEALSLEVEEASGAGTGACCAVRKDGGDDVDATHGMLIYARVRPAPGDGVRIDGGEGVGRVTRPGLEQPVGAAAINRVPREMIERAVREVLPGGVSVEVFAPKGEAVAARTYNPRLGIVGGISILGTTGIVEPMSERALVDTIRAELRVLRAASDGPVLATPGNYGEAFARETLGLSLERSVLCSNFLGDTVDYASHLGFAGLLLVGHLGKLCKIAGGIFNTHSRVADARMEILAAHAALAGATGPLAARLLDAPTTDRAVELLEESGLLERVMGTVTAKIGERLQARAGGMPAGAVIFLNGRGVLGVTGGARGLLGQLGKVGKAE